MHHSLRFKTITFALLLSSILIFLTFFLIGAYRDSKGVIDRQSTHHITSIALHYEQALSSYLGDVEESLLTLRSNEGLVEAFHSGDETAFLDGLADWEERFEKAQYDFVAVTFPGTGKCFLFSGYFTDLANVTCADLFTASSHSYGWEVSTLGGAVLGTYLTPLNLKHSGKVIGQLIGGVKLSGNTYLLNKISAGQEALAGISIEYGDEPLVDKTFTPLAGGETSLLHDDGPTGQIAYSKGETPLGPELAIKVRATDHSLNKLREELFLTFIFGGTVALVISLALSLLFSKFVDAQLQTLIEFTRKAHRDKDTDWQPTSIKEFNVIGAEVADIIKDLKQKEVMLGAANRNLSKSYSDKRRILHHLIRSEEQERSRLALELHDDMGQLLAAVRVNLHFLKEEVTDAGLPDKNVVASQDIINSMYGTVYNRIMSLRPFEMNNFGLDVSLPKIPLIGQLETMDYAVELNIDPTDGLSDEVMSNLYRITQAALSNVMKHAHGTYVGIHLTDEPAGVRLRITDDGMGIPAGVLDGPSIEGFGLSSIRERTEYINGELHVNSEDGCVVEVFVPAAYAYAQAQVA